jgi:hypothetical protein
VFAFIGECQHSLGLRHMEAWEALPVNRSKIETSVENV